MKFSQEFTGVIAGEIYPRVFAPGEDCPPELLEAAKSVGAVRTDKVPCQFVATPTLTPDEAKAIIAPKRGRKAK